MDQVNDRDSMCVNRDRKFSTIVGDSGGYQIGKGVIKFDWKDFEGNKANKVRSDILNWLELTSDWAMTLGRTHMGGRRPKQSKDRTYKFPRHIRRNNIQQQILPKEQTGTDKTFECATRR